MPFWHVIIGDPDLNFYIFAMYTIYGIMAYMTNWYVWCFGMHVIRFGRRIWFTKEILEDMEKKGFPMTEFAAVEVRKNAIIIYPIKINIEPIDIDVNVGAKIENVKTNTTGRIEIDDRSSNDIDEKEFEKAYKEAMEIMKKYER
ncbi:MAG: hypothetical protein J7K23_00950 [Thermoproteales archaeon]|nr:hypothetical protein [Thermoproteales archaeon]